VQATFLHRRSDLLIRKIKEWRIAFQRVMKTCPFTIDGIVVLPEHIHMTMTLPHDDTNYSQRISFIKSAFSRQIVECINSSRRTKRERAIWQRRFWEHLIRDEQDYEKHLDYIHYNPVKHGHVKYSHILTVKISLTITITPFWISTKRTTFQAYPPSNRCTTSKKSIP